MRLTSVVVASLLSILTAVATAQAEVPAIEREALIALYNATNGPGWTNNGNWLGAPGTENTWNGVTTDAGNTTVILITLPSNQLNGTIPAEIGNLTNLQGLWLYDNQLSGSIPPSLGNLTSLQQLYIFDCQLSGSIPSSLGNLSSLHELGLGGNQLSGAIPAELGGLASLQVLHLYGNQLSGAIPGELGNLASLQELLLRYNQLSGIIPSSLGDLANLRRLVLQGNQLAGSIPPELGSLTKLVELYLFDNQLTGEIPPELGNLGQLGELLLYSNQLTGAIPPEIGTLSNLVSLWLFDNQLSGDIPPELGNLVQLEELLLYYNQLTGAIPPELGNLSSLRHLDFGPNQLTGEIPATLGNLSQLEILWLGLNQLSGAIPAELGNLGNLQELWLTANQHSGTIPAQLGDLTKLLALDLYGNQLSGSIPPELGNLASLQRMSLAANQLGGSIPPELGNLASLRVLYLHSNQLNGGIPPEFGNLASLRVLYLQSNQLNGGIPPTLGDLTNLQQLALNGNQLSGSIPAELGSLANLGLLYLGDNQLGGSIPPEIGALSSLRLAGLENNRLSGSVPAELGGLTSACALDLSRNQLTGVLPDTLTNLTLLGSPDCNANNDHPHYPDFRSNGLYSFDPAVVAFLNTRQIGGDWQGTQTVAPDAVTAVAQGMDSVLVSWTPIRYTANDGGYLVSVATAAEGPFTVATMTTSKTALAANVAGLQPRTPYFFRVETVTEPHANNQNRVQSEPSEVVSSTTAGPEAPGVVQLSSAAYRAAEGERKVISVLRLGGVGGQAAVSFRTMNGTARAGRDYLPASGTLVWPDGDASARSFLVETLDDQNSAPDTSFFVMLEGFSGATAGVPTTAVVTILDNDFREGQGEVDVTSRGRQPAVAAAPDGSRLVVWSEPDRDGSGSGIFGQRFVAAGASVGAQLEVTSTTAGDQHSPAVAASPSGRFMVVGVSDGDTGATLFGRWFSAAGEGEGAEFVVDHATGSVVAPDVARRSQAGGYAVAWEKAEAGKAEEGGAHVRYIDDAGEVESDSVAIDPAAAASKAAVVDGDGQGGVVVAWVREDAGGSRVMARRFDDQAVAFGDPLVVSTGGNDRAPDVASLPDGGFMVVWEGGVAEADIFSRRFAADDSPVADPAVVNTEASGSQEAPRVAANDNGDCWMIWQHTRDDGGTVVAGRFLPACSTEGAEPEVVLSDLDSLTSVRTPSISFADDGTLTVVYVRDDSVEGDGGIAGTVVDQANPDPRRAGDRVTP